ncbi:unnamed protein product [Soboliphyme baturini]|uniref:Uncharacterized protein n=1 Tax=Soboliphyme baturini TaxID=241478 RepID=A0A183ITG9_9BILA|nr:unnamed protein product [Soboliphyme baturini]
MKSGSSAETHVNHHVTTSTVCRSVLTSAWPAASVSRTSCERTKKKIPHASRGSTVPRDIFDIDADQSSFVKLTVMKNALLSV